MHALLPDPAVHDAIVFLRRLGFGVRREPSDARMHRIVFPDDPEAPETIPVRRLLRIAESRGWVHPMRRAA